MRSDAAIPSRWEVESPLAVRDGGCQRARWTDRSIGWRRDEPGESGIVRGETETSPVTVEPSGCDPTLPPRTGGDRNETERNELLVQVGSIPLRLEPAPADDALAADGDGADLVVVLHPIDDRFEAVR